MSTVESKYDEVYEDKVKKTKANSIKISAFKTHVPPILGGLGEGNESTTTRTEIWTPELWNTHNKVIGVYHREFKLLQDQRLKRKLGINRELCSHMEERLIASKLLGKCGV